MLNFSYLVHIDLQLIALLRGFLFRPVLNIAPNNVIDLFFALFLMQSKSLSFGLHLTN